MTSNVEHFPEIVRKHLSEIDFFESLLNKKHPGFVISGIHPTQWCSGYTSDFLLAQVMRVFQILSRRQREMKIARVATLELGT